MNPTRGWDNTGANGANLSFPKEFGIEDNTWLIGVINSGYDHFLHHCSKRHSNTITVLLFSGFSGQQYALRNRGISNGLQCMGSRSSEQLAWQTRCHFSHRSIVSRLSLLSHFHSPLMNPACSCVFPVLAQAFTQNWWGLLICRLFMGLGMLDRYIRWSTYVPNMSSRNGHQDLHNPGLYCRD
jgi:hypothetical protein